MRFWKPRLKQPFFEQSLKTNEKVAKHLQNIKLHQSIRNIYTGEEASAQIGMPESAVNKVARQDTYNVRTEAKGTAQVGIFASGTSSIERNVDRG